LFFLSSLFQDEFSAVFSDRVPPPASKEFREKEIKDDTIKEESECMAADDGEAVKHTVCLAQENAFYADMEFVWRREMLSMSDMQSVRMSGGSPADQVIFPSAHDGPPADVRRTNSGRARGCPLV
jgi:hypothetical protein